MTSINNLLRALRISWIVIVGFGIIITSSILLESQADNKIIMIGAIVGLVVVLLGFFYGLNKIFDEPDDTIQKESAK